MRCSMSNSAINVRTPLRICCPQVLGSPKEGFRLTAAAFDHSQAIYPSIAEAENGMPAVRPISLKEIVMIKQLTAVLATTAFIALPASAAPVKMTSTQLDQIVAGTGEPIPQEKGNNGWGNGPDTTNPGSFSGGTAPSKSTNSSIPGGGINEAPQDRFTGR